MDTKTLNKATQILNMAAKIVWKQKGYDKNDPPEITPDKLRQWMPDISQDKLMPFHDLYHDHNNIPPKDKEPGNWVEKAWYRLIRCQLQHVVAVPTQTKESFVPWSSNSSKMIIPTTDTINKEEIKPRATAAIVMAAILLGWNAEPNLAIFKRQDGIDSLEDGIIAIHDLWKFCKEKYEGKFYHPIEPIVEAYLQEIAAKHITTEYDRKNPAAILKSGTMGSIRDLILSPPVNRIEKLGELKGISSPAPESLQLNSFELEESSILPAVLPLQAIHTVEGTQTTKRGAVAMPIRLFFEALMVLSPKETKVDIHFTLGNLLRYLNPDAKYNRTNHLPYVIKGLHALYWLRIPYQSDPDKPSTQVDWIPVLPRTVPNLQSGDDASIVLEVKVPPDAKQGMLVEKDTLRRLGKYSSARFNAYLTACWIFDKYGTRGGGIIDPTIPAEHRDKDGYITTADGQRIYDDRGKPLKSPYHKNAVAILEREDNKGRNKYPILSFDDLTRACYPKGFPSSKHATYQKRALKAWDTLSNEGYVRIEKNSNGWRIMPSESHVDYYRAFKNQSN